MASPAFTPTAITSGSNGWDTAVSDNFTAMKTLTEAPWPILVHSGDESDLQSTYAAASYDGCLVWVDHTEAGRTLYSSDGSAWFPTTAIWSATEHATGRKVDGVAEYSKVVTVGTLPDGSVSAATKNTAHSISTINLGKVVGIESVIFKASTDARPIPASTLAGDGTDILVDGSNVTVSTDWDGTGHSLKVRLTYAKV